MNQSRLRVLHLALTATATCLAFALSAAAQVQTQTSTSSGAATTDVEVQRGEVVYVSGNDLVVKMEDGTLRHFANVPESTRVNVDGQSLGIHDLKPGMKLQRTITTTTTPKTITTVQTVTGTVWHVTPPNSVVLTLEDGTNQSFKIPSGQKFTIDGQSVDAFGLKKGMRVSATKVVEVPETSVTVQKHVTGTMPPPPPAPPVDVPIIIAVRVPTPAPAAAETPAAPAAAPAELPKTASPVPVIGFMGILFVAVSLLARARRKFSLWT